MKHYKEKFIDENIVERTFKSNHDSVYPWHRDLEDRIIIVVESGKSWSFQLDNELPIDLKQGKIIKIPKLQFHRLIMGSDTLILKVIKDFKK